LAQLELLLCVNQHCNFGLFLSFFIWCVLSDGEAVSLHFKHLGEDGCDGIFLLLVLAGSVALGGFRHYFFVAGLLGVLRGTVLIEKLVGRSILGGGFVPAGEHFVLC